MIVVVVVVVLSVVVVVVLIVGLLVAWVELNTCIQLIFIVIIIIIIIIVIIFFMSVGIGFVNVVTFLSGCTWKNVIQDDSRVASKVDEGEIDTINN